MAPPVNENQVEAIARYMCIADGKHPDEIVFAFNNPDRDRLTGLPGYFYDHMPQHERWKEYRTIARRHLAAHLAIQIYLPQGK